MGACLGIIFSQLLNAIVFQLWNQPPFFYFQVRDADGRYRGTLEVSQDLTEIRKLEGQNRLPDWE